MFFVFCLTIVWFWDIICILQWNIYLTFAFCSLYSFTEWKFASVIENTFIFAFISFSSNWWKSWWIIKEFFNTVGVSRFFVVIFTQNIEPWIKDVGTLKRLKLIEMAAVGLITNVKYVKLVFHTNSSGHWQRLQLHYTKQKLWYQCNFEYKYSMRSNQRHFGFR